MALTEAETRMFDLLKKRLEGGWFDDDHADAYYEGAARVARLGLAVPPQMKMFETVVNWPRVVVDVVEERCDVKSLIRGGQDRADGELEDIWTGNNLDSEFSLTMLDSLIFGRGFLSVGANDEPDGVPIIAPESPREVAVDVDPRTRRVSAALKMYGGDGRQKAKYATLYTPDVTVWLERDEATWVETNRDGHGLGRVPVIPFFNRRRTGERIGRSEMVDAIPLTDAAVRNLTNLQVAQETHAVPSRFALGVKKSDFIDPSTNQPLPAWQAYFTALFASEDSGAKIGQLTASDLRNFHETTNHYSTIIAGLYGLPVRYFGRDTTNPPSADGIRADEARLVKRAERKMRLAGDQLARAMAYALRIKNGEWPDGDRIRVEWHDAATPTVAQREDALAKRRAAGVLSREGYWDELGWSEARKARERGYLADEQADPVLERLTRDLIDGSTAGDDGAAASVS